MSEIRLQVKLDTDPSWTDLVMYKAEAIPLSKSLLELQDISAQKVDQSKTIYLPSEEAVNDNYFGSFKDVTSNTFQPYEKLEARLVDDPDGVADVLIRGSLYFKGYNHANREYEVFISGKAGSIRGVLGEQTMDALLSEPSVSVKYAHELTAANLLATWNNSAAFTNIFYPINDWGNGYGLGADTSKVNLYDSPGGTGEVWDITNSKTAALVEDFRPGIKVLDTMKDILLINGFNLDTAELLTIYPMLIDLHLMLALPESGDDLVAAVADLNSESNDWDGETLVRFQLDGSVDGFDLRDLSTTQPSNGTYTQLVYTEANGKLNLGATMRYTCSSSISDNTPIKLTLSRERADSIGFTVIDEHERFMDYEDGGESFTLSVSVDDFVVEPGDKFMLRAEADFDHFENTYINYMQGYVKQESVLESRTIENYLKPLKQYDFVKGVLSHLGLYLDYNPSNDVFYLKSYDMIDTGVTHNWTEKMEYIGEHKIKSLTDFIAPQYLYKTGESESFLNELVQKEYETVKGEGYNYGSFKLDLGIQVAADESEFESLFAPCMVEKQAYSLAPDMDDMLISRSFDDVSNPTKSKHKYELFFKREYTTMGSNIQLRDVDMSTIGYSTKPVHSMTLGGLFCGFRYTTAYDGVAPNQDLFGAFHQQRWNEWIGLSYDLTNGATIDETKLKSARIVEGSIWLTPQEYSEFRFGDKITLDSGYGTATYRVLNITSFDPYERKAAKIKLIKIV